ncbi:MAG: polyamine ABC transporter substrate-binding protein [Rhodospirillales bacterium]|nr:polyamine ABC transporter substrate-binding protein [Rhodospirillales bacterium]
MRLLPLLAVFACLLLGPPALAQERVVNVYNWTDYTDPKALERFTAETGIKVQYDVFDSLETLEGKLLAGHSGYDVVVPSNEPTLSRLIKAGALAEIDRSRVPNWKNLDPDLMRRVETSDPGNRHGAIYLWGTIGLGVLPDKVRALAPDAAMDSWTLLFKPENAKRIAKCGITMMDSAIDVIPSVLAYLGKNPNSTDPGDLAAVEKTLMAIRPYIRTFASGGALEAMATGETCLVFDYSGDVIQAQARAAEAGRGVTVRYVAPKEATEVGFDMLAIPADAPHKAEALAFIDFMLRPDIAARNVDIVAYASANLAAKEKIKPAILADKGVYPDEPTTARLFTITSYDDRLQKVVTREWTRVTTGK